MATPTRIPIRLSSGAGESFGVDDIAVAAATSLGFWEREGLDVTWTPARGGVRAIEAVLAGQVDASYGTFAPAIVQRAAGKPVRVVASMARGLAQQLVVRSHITSTAELKGAKWAVDGIGALSHNMARLVVRGLQIPDEQVSWEVAGPPPQRIAKLISGEVDCALVRVEEATALVRDHHELQCLLGFEELKRLVPMQPHGVITTTEKYEQSPLGREAIRRLVRGLVLASRALHEQLPVFRQAVANHVKHVTVSEQEVSTIWEQEHNSGGFAVNGGLSRGWWEAQFALHYEMNPTCAKTRIEQLISPEALQQTLRPAPAGIGVHPAEFDQPQFSRASL